MRFIQSSSSMLQQISGWTLSRLPVSLGWFRACGTIEERHQNSRVGDSSQTFWSVRNWWLSVTSLSWKLKGLRLWQLLVPCQIFALGFPDLAKDSCHVNLTGFSKNRFPRLNCLCFESTKAHQGTTKLSEPLPCKFQRERYKEWACFVASILLGRNTPTVPILFVSIQPWT